MEMSGEVLGGSFFVHHTLNGRFSPFTTDVETGFYENFTRWSREFLIFDGRLAGGRRTLNPHFFRGLACDWLKEEGASNEAIAQYVGDDKATIEAKYLKKNTKNDIRQAIEESEGFYVAKQRNHDESALVKELMAELKSKNRMLETLTKEITHANNRADEQAKSYESRITRLEAQLAEERKARTRNHSQLMRALGRLN